MQLYQFLLVLFWFAKTLYYNDYEVLRLQGYLSYFTTLLKDPPHHPRPLNVNSHVLNSHIWSDSWFCYSVLCSALNISFIVRQQCIWGREEKWHAAGMSRLQQHTGRTHSQAKDLFHILSWWFAAQENSPFWFKVWAG